MKHRIAAIILAGAQLLAGCGNAVVGSGNVISESRLVGGVSAVTLAGSGELWITQGEVSALQL